MYNNENYFTTEINNICLSMLYSRFILIDWIVEVANMKAFSSLTVHLAVHLIDRYLSIRDLDRSNFQLLGISCLVLSSRWTSDVILTIREASWLTETTYPYDDVVRMTGDILAALHGNIGVIMHVYLCSLDVSLLSTEVT